MSAMGIHRARVSTVAVLVVLVVMLTGWTGRAQAAAPRTSVAAIRSYLEKASTARTVLGYVHMGAAYRGHKYLGEYTISGKPDWFGVEYRYQWADDGVTDLVFVCDEKGSVRDIRVTYTNAVLNQPWMLAQASIKLLSQAILDSSDLKPQQRALLQKLVDAEDVKGMLVFVLP